MVSSIKSDNLEIDIVFALGEANSGKSTWLYEQYGDTPDEILDIYCYQHRQSFPDDMDDAEALLIGNALFEADIYKYLANTILAYGSNAQKYALDHGSADSYTEKHLLVLEGVFIKKARRASFIQTIANFRHQANITLTGVWFGMGSGTTRVISGGAELPTEDEGFDKVIFIDRVAKDIKKRKPLDENIKQRCKRDRVDERDLFGTNTRAKAKQRQQEDHDLKYPLDKPKSGVSADDLKQARLMSGMTLKELSDAIGISVPTLSGLENGKVAISEKTYWKYRNFFNAEEDTRKKQLLEMLIEKQL